jgi:hypothetical protein
MPLTKKHAPSPQVRAARNRFESWRKSKQGRERIPEPLWAQAVNLCGRHSAHRVARWLRLNSTALRRRLNGNRQQERPEGKAVQQASFLRVLAAERAVLHSERRAPAFVEWAPASTAEYILEIEGRHGPNLRIRTRGAPVAEVAQLAGLLGRERE